MPEREIVRYPNDVLRKQAKSVGKLDQSFDTLIDDMIATMKKANGLGLAANQVGVLMKVLVYDDGNGPGVLINPEIIDTAGKQTYSEGCLSVPGLQGEVCRAKEIVVRGKNRHGKTVKIKAEGLLARIFQHEIDHLNGKLFIDRAEPGSLYYITEEEE